MEMGAQVHTTDTAQEAKKQENIARVKALLSHGSASEAARAVGVERTVFGKWMKRMGLDPFICRLGAQFREKAIKQLASKEGHPLRPVGLALGLVA